MQDKIKIRWHKYICIVLAFIVILTCSGWSESSPQYSMGGGTEEEALLQEEPSTYPAEFYINTKNNSLGNMLYFLNERVGEGAVTTTDCLYMQPEAVSKALGVVPDVSDWITSSQKIEWVTIACAMGKFRVIGQIVEKESGNNGSNSEEYLNPSFDSVDDLKTGEVAIGQIVSTCGYYHSEDGGAADYLITNGKKAADDCMIIDLMNGLQAELQVQNNTVVAEQFGAYGDGIHDDAVPIQRIIDMGYNLDLTAGKTYKLISNGIYISNPITINGNDAVILVDDSYSPTFSDFEYYCIRYKYGKQQSFFGINDLTIQINFSDGRISGREFVGLSPLYIDTVNLNGLNVVTNQSNNCVICVWLDRGCSSFVLKNSRLENHTSGKTGGALWITSKDDEIFGKFNAIDRCVIQNTTLYATSGDEVLAIWGSNDLSAIFENCIIEGYIEAPERHTRPIVVTGGSTKGAVFDVSFTDCQILAGCNELVPSAFYDSLLGVGSQYATDLITVNFTNCEIKSNVKGAMIFPSGYASDTSQLSKFDSNNPSVHINFSQCNIDTSHPITGSSMTYYNTAVLYPTVAWNCTFDACEIKCETAFAYLYMPWSKEYFVPQIELRACEVNITNAKDFICEGDLSAIIDLKIVDTTIQAEEVVELLTNQNNMQSTIKTQKNAINQVKLENVYLNGIRIAE